MMRIGLLTSGGDCQALNAAMRGVVKCLTNGEEDVEIYGFLEGYRGLIYGNFRMLSGSDFSGILTKGGTILGSSRTPFKTITDPDENGLNISQRNVTVSTCGIVPRMRELADKKLQITLALSLHASTQEKRLELMPVANKYEIHEVIDACKYYFEQTGRRVTFEYSLVGGVNDTDEDVRNLCRLIKGINCHVNLIPVNPIKERDYVQPDVRVTTGFKNKLEKNGINATIRREMGRDIDGACGQLRKRYMGS